MYSLHKLFQSLLHLARKCIRGGYGLKSADSSFQFGEGFSFFLKHCRGISPYVQDKGNPEQRRQGKFNHDCIYWVMDIDDEPRTQRKHKGKSDDDRPETTDKQRTIEPPERNQQDDDGMNPQERTLPYITPEPVKEQEPPKKEERPPIIFEFPRHSGRLKPKGKGKEQPDRGRG